MPELAKTVLMNNSNLKCYFKFESGALTTDSSGNGVTLTNTGSIPSGTGLFGGCADLGTSNATKSFSSSNTLSINGGAITMCGWFKLNTEIASSTQILLGHLNNTTATYERIVYDYNGGTRRILFYRTKPGVADQGPTHTITLGTSSWYHIALTYDGTNVRAYINGQCVGTAAASGNGTGSYTQGIFIGQDQGGGFQPSSLIEDVAFFASALTADQIKELYEGRFIGEAYPQSGLVAGYHLNGGSTDFSGSNYHGTDTAITYSQANGKFGQGAGFNGSSSVISLGTTINPFTGDFSLSAWIKLGATGADKTIFGKYGAGATDQWLLFYIVSTGVLSLSFYGDDLSSTKTISDTTSWHHVVATYAYGAKTKTLYIDGNQVAQANGTGNPNFGSNALLIGKLNTGTYWNGNIDEALVYNRVLTPQEIRRMYAQGTGKLQ